VGTGQSAAAAETRKNYWQRFSLMAGLTFGRADEPTFFFSLVLAQRLVSEN